MKQTARFNCVLAAWSLLFSTATFALSPPNLLSDINWDVDATTEGDQSSAPGIAPGSVEAIEAAFNNARRQEEIQLNVVFNSLGTLDLPSQKVWDAMTPSEKALMITNAERTARDGVNYPNHGTVLGLPLEAVESNLNKLAQDYADYMVDNNFWDHVVPASVTASPFAGTNSFTRISDHPVIGAGAGTAGENCHQFLSAAENLAASAFSVMNAPTPTTLIENAIYSWLYDDASSSWGHRVAMLLQDQSLSGNSGFNNDRGSVTSEGFMGIGVAGRGDGSYTVFDGSNFPSQWAVVWLVMDPAPDANCNFGIPINKQLPNATWQMVSLPATPPEDANTVAAIFGDDIAGTYPATWRVWSFDESIGESGGYVDPGLNGVLKPGEGYWIAQITGAPVTLDMPTGSTITPVTNSTMCAASSTHGCASHSLITKPAGQWNLLGNPYYTRPSVNNLRISTSTGVCADTDGCSITEAADRNGADVQHYQFWNYDGTSYGSPKGPGDQLQPWEAYLTPTLPGAHNLSPVLLIPRN
ncbi:MAG: CAP domain-containing protein [Granulosicoccus sp.]